MSLELSFPSVSDLRDPARPSRGRRGSGVKAQRPSGCFTGPGAREGGGGLDSEEDLWRCPPGNGPRL
ncbi:hypothetical protein EYF80_019546 [Liparis tanakae]|uniref:Uncharacterized protein n=1 Tax=Liparis tanakae TaxID=230148 RepID=A0A4Z2HZF8_9TELE|nr:hypothetical protein EYF80_019546 [Liparis tanakae]